MSVKKSNVFSKINPSVQNELSLDEVSRISLSHTSKGVLCKWTGILDGELYYIKTGRLYYGMFSNLEPIAECIASGIGNLLGINVIDTKCSDVEIDNLDMIKNQVATVSYTESFLNKDEVFYSIYKLEGDGITYKDLVDKYSDYKEDLNKMIIFDFIINNSDRHLNNFGFILDSDSLEVKRFNPIFDNGSSLLVDLSEEQLVEFDFKDIDEYSTCKPFINNHYRQLELIKDLPKINLDFGREEIESVVNEFALDLTNLRISKIINLIVRRLNYVKHLYSKV